MSEIPITISCCKIWVRNKVVLALSLHFSAYSIYSTDLAKIHLDIKVFIFEISFLLAACNSLQTKLRLTQMDSFGGTIYICYCIGKVFFLVVAGA